MYEQQMIELVKKAGELMTSHDVNLQVMAKGRANFVTQMDIAVQEYIRKGLQNIDSKVTLLAEEQDNGQVDPAKAYWILDPIDGTQNYIRHMGLSAIGLAYYAKGALQTGIVYNPFTKELFHAVRGQGAFLNGRPIHVTTTETLADSLVAIGTSPYDREYTDSNFTLFKDVFQSCLDIRRCGSACLDLAYVAAGRMDIYFERNLKPWDMAAGILLVQEAGGIVTNYAGHFPKISSNADIVAGNGRVNKEILEKISRIEITI